MGLIKVIKDAVGSTMADQWKEYFYCDSLSNDVLMVKGQKKVNGGRNGNNGSDNIISNGSVIAVNEGQCMIIVDQGAIVDVCADPGEFVFDNSSEPSLFYGNLGDSVKATFATMAKRFTFGGNTAKDQRVYYFNTKEILGNMYGTATPIPFHCVDKNTGYSFATVMRANGTYTFRIVDPLIFYKNICSNVRDRYVKTELIAAMRNEFIQAMHPVIAKISAQGVLPSELMAHTEELLELAKEALAAKWYEGRGIEMMNMTISPSFPEKDLEKINKWADTAVLRNGAMAQARQTEAMANMLENPGKGGDATSGMMNMMAMQMMNNMMNGGMMGVQQAPVQQQAPQMQAPVLGWTCSCGKSDNRGKFCAECGSPKPSEAGWTCSCGHVNQGKFCAECGSKKPAGAPMYKCDKCGWEPEDPANPPKFCPECGDVFNENDIV